MKQSLPQLLARAILLFFEPVDRAAKAVPAGFGKNGTFKMTHSQMMQFQILPQTAADDDAVENLLDAAFGLDRRTKTSYRLREGEQPLSGLSFVARDDNDRIVGSISFWQIHIGENGPDSILLGPLAVRLRDQGSGIGQTLMTHGIAAAEKAGHQLVVLVGDAPYYAKVGFRQIDDGQVIMPGPNDPHRLLYLELTDGALAKASGLIRSPGRYRTAPFFNNIGSK